MTRIVLFIFCWELAKSSEKISGGIYNLVRDETRNNFDEVTKWKNIYTK